MEGRIQVQCGCGSKLAVPAQHAGRKVRCPKCKGVVDVPAAEASPEPQPAAAATSCPACGRENAMASRPGGLQCMFCGASPKGAPDAQPPRRRPLRRPLGRPGSGLRRAALAAGHRYVNHEAHIRALAIWARIGGIFAILGGIIFMAFLTSIPGGARGAGAFQAIAGVFGVILLAFGVGYLLIGIYMAKYHAWARWTYVGLTSLGMLMNLLGFMANPVPQEMVGVVINLAWAGACLWVMLGGPSATIFTDDYRALVASMGPSVYIPTYKSPFFWIPAALFGLAIFCCFIAFGVGMAAN